MSTYTTDGLPLRTDIPQAGEGNEDHQKSPGLDAFVFDKHLIKPFPGRLHPPAVPDDDQYPVADGGHVAGIVGRVTEGYVFIGDGAVAVVDGPPFHPYCPTPFYYGKTIASTGFIFKV